jgi:holo-[acyl-carrier protein] synthase
MFCLGTDIIEISRIAGACERLGERFINRIYTAGEITACKGSAPSLAARFAAKEAAMKALGRGFYDIPWTDIEVVSDDSGQPRLKLHGKAAERAAELNVAEYAVSLSHAKEYATAVVLGHQHG